jgi:hypothetical protein
MESGVKVHCWGQAAIGKKSFGNKSGCGGFEHQGSTQRHRNVSSSPHRTLHVPEPSHWEYRWSADVIRGSCRIVVRGLPRSPRPTSPQEPPDHEYSMLYGVRHGSSESNASSSIRRRPFNSLLQSNSSILSRNRTQQSPSHVPSIADRQSS